MAIAYDATSGAARGWVTSDSFAHVCTGSDRLLLVWVYFDRGNGTYNVSSLTYAGAALTQVGTFNDGTHYAELWRSASEPASGSNTLAASYNNAGPTAKVAIRAFSYTGVDQTTPLGTLVNAHGYTTTATVDASSASGEVVADMGICMSAGANMASGSGQTSRYELDAGASGIAAFGYSDEAGAASVTMSWTGWVTDYWMIGAIPIKPVGAATGGVPKTTRQTLLGVG